MSPSRQSPRQSVIDTDNPQDFAALQQPEIMAVVWHGPWSKASLAFAGKLASNPAYLKPDTVTYLKETRELSEEIGPQGLNFQRDLARISALFKAVGADLSNKNFVDSSRVEPMQGDMLSKVTENLHVDGGALGLFSTLTGPTTQYLTHAVKGEFEDDAIYFTPASAREAERHVKAMDHNAVAIFKCNNFPFPEGSEDKGLIHRRPSNVLELERPPGRVLVHLKLK